MELNKLNGYFDDINRILKKEIHDKKKLDLSEKCRLFRFLALYQNCEGEEKGWCDIDICKFGDEINWIKKQSLGDVEYLCDLIQSYLDEKIKSRPDPWIKGNTLEEFFDEIYTILEKGIRDENQLDINEKYKLFEFFIYHQHCWENVNEEENCYPNICRFASAVNIEWALNFKYDNLCELIRNYYLNDMKIIPPKGGDAMGGVVPGDGFKYH